MRFLIIKTSAIGDIIQSLNVLEYIHTKFLNIKIDWILSKEGYSIIKAHPLINRAILFKKEDLFSNFLTLKKKIQTVHYDYVIDLQGNCKSGLITLLAKGDKKIGFDCRSVAEFPNIFCSDFQYGVDKKQPIALQYLSLVKSYFNDKESFIANKYLLKLDILQKKALDFIVERAKGSLKILISPSSRWKNKKLNINVLRDFLYQVDLSKNPFFLFISGNEEEKQEALFLSEPFKRSMILDRLDLALLQNLLNEVDLIISMDSFLLHLAATVDTPSFSFFGPSSSEVYKPVGMHHYALQGKCPFFEKFVKRCPKLRSCQGYCMDQSLDEICKHFNGWFDSLIKNNSFSKSK